MITYLNMEGWKNKDLKSKDFDSIKELFNKALKRVNMFVDFRTELVEGSSKRAGIELEQEVTKKQKVDNVQETVEVDNDQEAAKIKELMKIVSEEEEVEIDDIPLDVKPPSIGRIVEIKSLLNAVSITTALIDVNAAQSKLLAQEQEELSIEEKATLFQQLLVKRRKHFAAKRVEEKRNKPPTKAQQRKIICTYLKNMEGYKLQDLKLKGFDSIQEMFDRAFKRVNTFEDFRTELVKGKEKRARTELIQENAKRENLEDLYKLVKAKYESTRPVEDLDLLLWGDLKTIFEPHVEDNV
ncbi:hypothetical protein Tco_1317911 [Tanacetum coccineum]